MKWLKDHFEEGLMAAFCAMILVLIFVKAFVKFISPDAVAWMEELSKYLFVYVSFLATGYCAKLGNNMCVDILFNKLFKGGARRAVLLFGEVLYVVLSAALFIGAVLLVKTAAADGAVSELLGIPMGVVYFGAVLGYITAIFRSVQNLLRMFKEPKAA